MKVFSMVAAGVVGSLLAWGAVSALTPAGEHTVQITDQGFSPDRIEITAGQPVVWKNGTLNAHNVTCSPLANARETQEKGKPLFDSGAIQPGNSYEFTFKEAGTYEYHCAVDKSMKGRVVVNPAKK